MTSRERVWRAIHFKGPDRIPHYLPDGEPNDIVWLWPERPGDRQPWTTAVGEGRSRGGQQRIDAWGVVWERPNEETFGEAVRWPFEDVTRHRERDFPDMNAPVAFAASRARIVENAALDNPRYCLGVMPFSSLNEGTHNIMGLENLFLAYYEHPVELKELIGRLADAQLESIERLHEIGCDGVMAYDDWGLQDRPMVGMPILEEFFLPFYRRNWARAHELGMDVWMHSCGHTLGVLPCFADAGLNVAQLDQQENMGLEALDTAVGGRLAFWCPVDIQKTMVEGSIADIERYARRMIATLGGHDGGLVSMAYSSPEAVHHTPEKIAAMCRAFRTHGVYAPRKTT